MIMRHGGSKLNVGIVGASGFTGAELLRLCALHPDLEVVLATGDTQAGVRAADALPEPGRRLPATSCSPPYDPAACEGLDLVFLALPARGRPGIVPDLAQAGRRTRRPVGRLPAEGPVAVPDVVRRGAPRSRACWPSSSSGCPSCSATRSTVPTLVAAPGCYVTAASLALAPLVRLGLIEPTGVIVDAASGVSGAGRRPEADDGVLHGRRGLHRLRPARPPPHARDRAGHRRPGAVHPAPGADEPGHPGHLLRPAGRQRAPSTADLLDALGRASTPTSRSWS